MHKDKIKLGIYLIVLLIFSLLVGKAWSISIYGLLYLYTFLVSSVLLLQFAIAFIYYRDPYITALEKLRKSGPINKTIGSPLVSLMVAVKDEADMISLCLDSLIAQTYRRLEIIIVNDGSEDETAEVLNRYSGARNLQIVHLRRNVGKKRALAKAMSLARGEIFAFTDSDSVLETDAISKIVDIFVAYPDVGAVSGHCRALNADKNFLTKVQDTWYEGQFSIRKAFESYFGAVTCISGPLAVFRRQAILNFVPAWENDIFLGQEFKFATDRTMTGFVLGNKYIGKKLKDKYSDSPFIFGEDYPCRDWKVVYTRSARALTNVPDTVNKVVRQQIRWKKSFIRNLFFTGSFYWRKNFVAALVYYLHAVFVLVGPFIAFRHLILLPIVGNALSVIFFLSGILFVGLVFGLAYRKFDQDKAHRWIYRPVMSLSSTLFLSWLIFYSAVTIRRNIWSRG